MRTTSESKNLLLCAISNQLKGFIQGLATQEMKVEMKYGLPPLLAGVDDRSKSGRQKSFLTRYLVRKCEESPHQSTALSRITPRSEDRLERSDMVPGHDQQMLLRLRTRIRDTDELVILSDLQSRDHPLDDLAEDAVGGRVRLRAHEILSICAPSC